MKKLFRKLKRVLRKAKARITSTDPLNVLREDTYSNEELDEMTGRMHRKQYADEQGIETDFKRLD